MDLINSIFIRKRMNVEKLKNYGFESKSDVFSKRVDILDGSFYIIINIENSKVSASVFDSDFNEEYNLIFMDRVTGEFVGNVREAFKAVLNDVATSCFDDVMFETDQANRIAKYIYNTYKVEPEFPWSKYDFAVFRNKDNGLWFALFGSFKEKETNIKRIIVNVKVDETYRDELCKIDGIIPAYHMNKKKWITIYLDDTLQDEYIESLIDYSYNSNVGIKNKRYHK